MAATTTIRVREQTRAALAEIAQRDGRTIPQVVDALVARATAEAAIDRHLVCVADAADAWAGELGALDGTLADGLADDPWPLDDAGQPAR